MSANRLVKHFGHTKPQPPVPAIPAMPVDHTGCIDRNKLIEAIDRFVSEAGGSPIWTHNERRAARSIALYLQQQMGLPITYGP